MNVDKLWAVRVHKYTDEVFVSVVEYKHIVASHLGFCIGVENFRVLMVERAVDT